MNDLAQVLLLADIEDVIGGLMALLVPLLWVIKQIVDSTKKENKPAEAAQAAPRQQEPAAPRQAAGQQADPLRNQVEEFLRRAGKGPAAERGRAAPPGIELLIDDAVAKSIGVSKVTNAQSKPPAQPHRPVAPRKRKSLAERATERAAARATKLAEQASQLGQRIVEEDQQFDVQLKAKFDHSVGTLTGSAAPPPTEPVAVDTPASQIAAMLASPEGVRQAIVVNEILRRPTDRW
jgi:hypothetical protein